VNKVKEKVKTQYLAKFAQKYDKLDKLTGADR